MTVERVEERAARHVLASVLGVEVYHHDDNSRPGMVDLTFDLPTGGGGAAEVTLITDPRHQEWHAESAKHRLRCNSRWAWLIQPNRRWPNLRELREHLPVIVRMAEERDEAEIDRLLAEDQDDPVPALEWARASGIRIRGLRGSNHPGAVFFLPDGSASWVPRTLDGVVAWVESDLADRCARKIRVLQESGRDEKHLVLVVDVTAPLPAEHLAALTDAEVALPSRSPSLPCSPLAGLWLVPSFGSNVVCWTAGGGWARHTIVL